MAGRPTRSASINIPNSSSSGPSRGTENIALSRSQQPQMQGESSSTTQASIGLAETTAHRSSRNGRNGSSSSSLPNRPRISSSFAPTYVRGTIERSAIAMTSSASATRITPQSPSRPRTASGQGRASAVLRPPSATSYPPGSSPPPNLIAERPAYLEQSALREFLHLEGTIRPSSATMSTPRDNSLASVRNHLSRPSRLAEASNEGRAPIPKPYQDSASRNTLVVPTGRAAALLGDQILNLPSRWNEMDRCQHLFLSTDGKELRFDGPGNPAEKEAAAARTNFPIPPACGIYYYEVQIVDRGSKGHISVGFAASDVRLSRLPGWERHSWGYHGDDGRSFASQQDGSPYGPKFTTGDVIGCGIDFIQNQAFYTKNGRFLGMVFSNLDCPELFPSVGLRTPGETIRTNFGDMPFVFDIDSHVQQQKNRLWEQIMSIDIHWKLIQGNVPNQSSEDEIDRDCVFQLISNKATSIPQNEVNGNGTLGNKSIIDTPTKVADTYPSMLASDLTVPINELILAYLSHHGYAETAKAFGERWDQTRRTTAAKIEPTVRTEDAMDITDDHSHLSHTISAAAPTSRSKYLASSYHDTQIRQQIVSAILLGDIDTAIQETQTYFPAALESEDGVSLLYFKLRCRKFVELLLESAQALRAVKMGELTRARGENVIPSPMESAPTITNGGGAGLQPSFTTLMDLDHTSAQPSRNSSPKPHGKRAMSPGSAPVPKAQAALRSQQVLHRALLYGQALQADFGEDPRPQVEAILKQTISLVALDNPYDHPQASDVVGQKAREELAEELNRTILETQGRPVFPTLERVYRQVAATVTQLGRLGVGMAAFADVEREMLADI